MSLTDIESNDEFDDEFDDEFNDEFNNDEFNNDEFNDWAALPKLADPIEPGRVLSSPEARASLHAELIGPTTKRNRSPILIGSAAVVAIATTIAVTFAGSTSPAEAVTGAVANTLSVQSGHFTTERSVESGDKRLDQEITVLFNGDDFEIHHQNQGGILPETGGNTTPAEMTIRRTDDTTYVRVANGWVESPDDVVPLGTDPQATPEPLGAIGQRIEMATAAATDLAACPTTEPGLTSYCFSTSDPELIATLEPGSTTSYVSIRAEVRVEIDDSTGQLAAIHVDADNVEVDSSALPGLTVPPIDSISSTTRFDGLGQTETIKTPDLGLDEPADLGQVPWQCEGLEATLTIVDCLRHYGYDELAEYYTGLDLPPDPDLVINQQNP